MIRGYTSLENKLTGRKGLHQKLKTFPLDKTFITDLKRNRPKRRWWKKLMRNSRQKGKSQQKFPLIKFFLQSSRGRDGEFGGDR